MTSKIKFYTKLIFYNPLFLICILVNLFLLYKQSPSLIYEPVIFTQVFCFGFMASNLFLLIISAFLTNKKYELLELYEKDKINKQIAVVTSGFLVSLVISIPTIFVIVFFLYKKYSYTYILSIVSHFLILWNLSNLLSLCIGTTIGNIIKTKFYLLLSIGVYSLFVLRLYSISNSLFYRLFNIFDDSTIIFNYKTNIVFDIPYILDKVFILILAIVILNISNLFCKNSTLVKVKILFMILAFIALIINIYMYYITL